MEEKKISDLNDSMPSCNVNQGFNFTVGIIAVLMGIVVIYLVYRYFYAK